jgi:hypothetical protein
MANLASITPYLKEVYTGKIRRQLNDDITTLKRITRSDANISSNHEGKYVTFPVHVRRNAGIGSRLESEALPNPGQQGYASAQLQLKSAYGAIELTGQALDMADSDTKAFAKSVDEEMERLRTDLKKDMNRQIYGDGTGAISAVKTTNAATTVIAVNDARLFQIGEIIDIVTLPSTVAVSGRTVNAVDLTAGANTVTISGANVSVTAGQILVRSGSLNREITGFGAIVRDTGTLYNINPATEPEWKSEVDANGGVGRPLSEGLMVTMADRVRTRGGKTTVIFQSLGVRRAYFNLLSQMRSIVNTTDFEGGFKGLSFTTDVGEIPVVADVDAPLGTQYFINEDALTWYRHAEWDWLDKDGSMWSRKRSDSAVYEVWQAWMVERHELGTDRRNTHGVIRDITEA